MPSFFATLAVWIICFICTAKGIKSIGQIVKGTVPLPFVFLMILIIGAASLQGSIDGVRKYMTGEGLETVLQEADEDFTPGLNNRAVWVDAVGQVFFSLGVCMGIMTAYGSYNERDQGNVIQNAVIISVADTLFSFLSGFAVWSMIGFLEFNGDLTKGETSSTGLVFVSMPSAIDRFSASNFW